MRTVRRWIVGIAAVVLVMVSSVRADVGILEKTGNAFAQIAKEALPAVVFIDVENTVEVPQYGYRYHPFDGDFGQGRRGGIAVPEELEPRKYSQQGQGSGFIISKDGYILTNNHMVDEADHINVTLGDGRKFEAKLVGTDPKTEVALIKIEDGADLPFLALGDSDALQVGEWVLAAGNPFGLSQTITAGIVSAKGRDETGIAEYGNFIQTDAAINPGNSGGPLLNIRGEAVGINTAIYTRTGGYMGIGFAIPINLAVQIKDQLITHGKVQRSVLGVYIQEVDEDLAKSFGLEESGGILISHVMEDSAAEAAGLQGGDIIVEMDGQKVGKVGAFRNRVAATPPNSKVKLRIFRDGKFKNMPVITQALEGDGSEEPATEPAMYEKMGISIENLDKETASQLGYADEKGVVITEVEQGGTAWRAGLQPGLIVVSVNRQPVGNVREFKKALENAGDGGKVLLLVKDGRSSRFIVVKID
jgi:serine protease Do